MNKPYVICHMLISIDGKVTGDFLFDEKCNEGTEIYYKLNRNYKADAFACGRVTMEESFTKKYYPDLNSFKNIDIKFEDFIADNNAKLYAISFDRKGRVGWKKSYIEDDDPGYGNSHIIEVLTTNVDKAYLAYLKSINVSYIFAGDSDIDINIALTKLYKYFNIKTLLLEGGSIINGAFLKANVIDELSLVTVPLLASKEDKPLFYNSSGINCFKLIDSYVENNIIISKYIKEVKE